MPPLNLNPFSLSHRLRLTVVGVAVTFGLSTALPAQAQSTSPITSSKTDVALPHVQLSAKILFFQIISDLSFYRGDLATAYEGYMKLAEDTHDPRYANSAYLVATAANSPEYALKAVRLLKSLDKNAVVDDRVETTLTLAEIFKQSEQGQTQKAYGNLKNFLQEQPKSEIGLALLAELASKLNKNDEALYAFEQLHQRDPQDPEAMNNLGFFLADHNIRLAEARALIQAALKKSPQAPHIIDSAAWLSYREHNFPEAIRLAQQAHQLSPNPDISLHLAEILWVGGDKTHAKELFGQLKNGIGASDTAIRRQLNETLNRLGVE